MSAAIMMPFKISSVFGGGGGGGAVAAFPADEEAICCLCHDGNSAEKPLLTVSVCSCKGTMRFHRDCVFEMAKHNPVCGACKKLLLNPDYVGLYYDAADPELTGAHHAKRQYTDEVYGVLHDFYYPNEAGKKHGISKVYFEQHSGYYAKSSDAWTIYEVKHYNNGVLHGPYKKWSHHELKQVQFPEVEATYDQGVLRGPFKLYDSYRDGRLTKTGTLYSTPLVKPDGPLGFGLDALYIGEYKEDAGGRWGITTHCTFKVPSFSLNVLSSDHAALAAFVAKLADGKHIIPYCTSIGYYGAAANSDGRISLTVRNGLLEGAWTATLFSGEVAEQRHYVAGKLHGPYKRMHYLAVTFHRQNEKVLGVAEEGVYVAGRHHGKFIRNAINTSCTGVQPFLRANYSNGVRIGQQMLYDFEGQLLETTTLAADGSRTLDGPAVFYAGGRAVQRCNFRGDVLHGKLTLYRVQDGMPWLQLIMDAGKLRGGSWITRYDSAGVIDKAASERVKVDGDFLAAVEELDNCTVRCLASTDAGYVCERFVVVREEPPLPEDACDEYDDSYYPGDNGSYDEDYDY